MNGKKIVIIAGPNGAGKTTFAREFLRRRAGAARWAQRPGAGYTTAFRLRARQLRFTVSREGGFLGAVRQCRGRTTTHRLE